MIFVGIGVVERKNCNDAIWDIQGVDVVNRNNTLRF